MMRNEFFQQLCEALQGLPQSEINRITEYYEEIFNEAIDEGKSEEEVCESLDTPQDIAGRVRAEIAFVRAEQEPSAKSMSTVLVVLLGIFALPVGLPIAIAVLAIVFSLIVTVLSLAVAFGATVIGLGAGGIVGIAYGIALLFSGSVVFGLGLIGASFVILALGVLGGLATYYAFRALFRLVIKCCRSIYNWGVNRKTRRKTQ